MSYDGGPFGNPLEESLGAEPSFLAWHLPSVLPKGEGIAVVLRAYFDAGAQGDTFCVAGVAFTVDGAIAAERAWVDLWGNHLCHMTDLHNRKADFSGWSPEQGAERLKACIPIMRRSILRGVCVSVSLKELAEFAPMEADPDSVQYQEGFRTAYAFCSQLAMKLLAGTTKPKERIAYYFEHGDDYQSESQRFIAVMTKYREVAQDMYRWASHSIASKSDVRLFEMADILAWEWARNVNRTSEGKSMRPSLQSLIQVSDLESKKQVIETQRFHFHHVGRRALQRFSHRISETGLLKDDPSQEELRRLYGMALQYRPSVS